MVLKKHRLRKKKDFERVFNKGRGAAGSFLAVRSVKNNTDFSRLGIVVSGKVSKKAVERNKIRRRIRESLNLRMPNIKKGFDIVILTSKNVSGKSFRDIGADIDVVLRKAGLK